MDDNEDNGRYPSNPYSRPIENQYVDEYDDDDDIDLGEEEENCNQNNGVRYVGKDMNDVNGDDDDDDDDDDESEEFDDGNEDDYNENGDQQKGYDRKNDDVDSKRHPKKRKLKSLLSSYEFAPRVSAPSVPKPSLGGRNALTDWSESETFVLLDAWGELFLQHGRKSLRYEEWQEVAEKVSDVSKIERTDTQCRNRLDTLKKKYKKEKLMLAEIGVTSSTSVYFKKMDMLMSSPPQQGGVSCGLDSGEYANGLDKMRDRSADSESADGEEDESDGLPPKKRKFKRRYDEGASFGLLADMIQKFSNTYEKIEKNKMQQMSELAKMRMDSHRELEKQNQQIMERAQAEIAKIHQQADDDTNASR